MCATQLDSLHTLLTYTLIHALLHTHTHTHRRLQQGLLGNIRHPGRKEDRLFPHLDSMDTSDVRLKIEPMLTKPELNQPQQQSCLLCPATFRSSILMMNQCHLIWYITIVIMEKCVHEGKVHPFPTSVWFLSPSCAHANNYTPPSVLCFSSLLMSCVGLSLLYFALNVHTCLCWGRSECLHKLPTSHMQSVELWILAHTCFTPKKN